MESRAAMNVSLPESMRKWIEDTVAKDGYGTVSEYIRELVRQDQRKRTTERVEARLMEAIESGPATPLSRADWDHIRAEVRQRLARRPRKRAG